MSIPPPPPRRPSEESPRAFTCRVCMYWDPSQHTPQGYQPETGRCRLRAPRVQGYYSITKWPETSKNDWCGEGKKEIGA